MISTRDELAKHFHELGFKLGVEVGVERGHFSKVLLGVNPDLFLYCVDAWKAYPTYREHVTQAKLDGFYLETDERLSKFYPRYALVRAFSVDAARDFEDESIDFVYLDANHTFEQVTADIAAWAPKVRVGGIVSGHDYCRRGNMNYGVIEAVKNHVKEHSIKDLTILRGDKSPSWMYVKS